MNEENIRKYAALMKELGLTALEVDDEGTTVRLERMPQQATRVERVIAAGEGSANAESVQSGGKSGRILSEDRGADSITSPMVGVFYAAPAENAEPFVKQGDRVKKGDTLCIIEAMKLMNEITAERDGIISEICASNGQVVDFGTVLFKLM